MHGGDSQMQHYGCKYVLSKAMVKALPMVVLMLVVAHDLVDSMDLDGFSAILMDVHRS